MLGHQVFYYLKSFSGFIVYDISFRSKLTERTRIIDVKNILALESYIAELQPEYIINCIGILVTGSQDEGNAIYLNAFLPHKLAAIARTFNLKLIHISTDCVFSGSKGQYLETDLRDGRGVYAQTKILGEIVDDINLTLTMMHRRKGRKGEKERRHKVRKLSRGFHKDDVVSITYE